MEWIVVVASMVALRHLFPNPSANQTVHVRSRRGAPRTSADEKKETSSHELVLRLLNVSQCVTCVLRRIVRHCQTGRMRQPVTMRSLCVSGFLSVASYHCWTFPSNFVQLICASNFSRRTSFVSPGILALLAADLRRHALPKRSLASACMMGEACR